MTHRSDVEERVTRALQAAGEPVREAVLYERVNDAGAPVGPESFLAVLERLATLGALRMAVEHEVRVRDPEPFEPRFWGLGRVQLPDADADDWRRRFQRIALEMDYPMFIVTTSASGRRSGCLVGFATQISIHPPRLLVGISRRNHTYRVAREASALAVHFPGRDQLALAELFGGETGDEVDKFASCDWSDGPEGLPILADCPSWAVGRIADRLDIGDHMGCVLDVIDARHDRTGPQLGFQDVRGIEPGHAP